MIAAIDPGPFESAYVLLGNSGTIVFAAKLTNHELLKRLRTKTLPTMSARLFIEMVANYGMPAGRELFETCVWIGKFAEASDVYVDLVYRKTVCGHICKDARAKDANIRQALIDRYGPQWITETYTPTGAKGQPLKERTRRIPGPTNGITADCWSALAIATYALDTQRRVV
jgi:hypothetical protein